MCFGDFRPWSWQQSLRYFQSYVIQLVYMRLCDVTRLDFKIRRGPKPLTTSQREAEIISAASRGPIVLINAPFGSDETSSEAASEEFKLHHNKPKNPALHHEAVPQGCSIWITPTALPSSISLLTLAALPKRPC